MNFVSKLTRFSLVFSFFVLVVLYFLLVALVDVLLFPFSVFEFFLAIFVVVKVLSTMTNNGKPSFLINTQIKYWLLNSYSKNFLNLANDKIISYFILKTILLESRTQSNSPCSKDSSSSSLAKYVCSARTNRPTNIGLGGLAGGNGIFLLFQRQITLRIVG